MTGTTTIVRSPWSRRRRGGRTWKVSQCGSSILRLVAEWFDELLYVTQLGQSVGREGGEVIPADSRW